MKIWQYNRPARDYDMRVVHRFAWLPVYCQDNSLRWLEKVKCIDLFADESKDGGSKYWYTARRYPLK
jgi:hypothetical protein